MNIRPWSIAAVAFALLAPAAFARPTHEHRRPGGRRGRAQHHVGTIIYYDPSAASSADVEQVLPNSRTETTAMTSVREISMRRGVFIFRWGHGALTILPQRYVINVTVNKHRMIPQRSATPNK